MKRFFSALRPKHFRFSWRTTLICVALSSLMLYAASWQWERYLWKKDLVETYQEHSETPPLPFPINAADASDYQEVLNRKVSVPGVYDYEHEMLVINRRHASGPGYWLLTPFKPEGSERYVIVSRGFIPYADREPASWEKYRFSEGETLLGVVQPTVVRKTILSPRNPEPQENTFERKWLYPDIARMAKQLPYPVYEDVFLQRLGGPPHGTFPADSVTVTVPPSTHFGYTIEWTVLAVVTLAIGFLLQALPRKRRQRPQNEIENPNAPVIRSKAEASEAARSSAQTNGAYRNGRATHH